ncbi:MAG TPA: antitoxin VapB family protein [Gemmatimonadota bacterium]|nr:antitoxin VapB family protein [Gemmatimonadota bacterium]
MSTKTIAVDTRVYDRLASIKRRGESFSKAIDRLLTEVETAHTGSDILRALATIAPLSQEDSRVFLEIVAESRASERWDGRDLR